MESYFPPVCQAYFTRQCNESCDSCKLRRNHYPESDFAAWKEYAKILDSGGVRLLKLLGGEPTMRPWLPAFVLFVNSETKMLPVVLSNCRFDEKMERELLAAGLWGFFASYDYISEEATDLGMQRKARLALDKLLKMKRGGVKVVGANVVIASHNIEHILELVDELSELGIWTNLCPVICGGEGEFIFRSADSPEKLTMEHQVQLQKLSEELLVMKSQGALITASAKYLAELPESGINLNWHCKNRPPLLQLDADGTILACPDVYGWGKVNITDLADAKSYNSYLETWQEDVKSCSGCYWSATVSGEEDFDGLPEYAK